MHRGGLLLPSPNARHNGSSERQPGQSQAGHAASDRVVRPVSSGPLFAGQRTSHAVGQLAQCRIPRRELNGRDVVHAVERRRRAGGRDVDRLLPYAPGDVKRMRSRVDSGQPALERARLRVSAAVAP